MRSPRPLASGVTARRLRLAAEAVLALAFGWVLAALPFRWGARVLGGVEEGDGGVPPERPDADTGAVAGPVGDVRWAVAAVAHRLPWRSTCLHQSYAGVLMLRARRVPSTTVVGVRRLATAEGPDLAAHAWTEAPGGMVTGGAGHRRFRPLAVYRRPAGAPPDDRSLRAGRARIVGSGRALAGSATTWRRGGPTVESRPDGGRRRARAEPSASLVASSKESSAGNLKPGTGQNATRAYR
jgi:hypothetical protein